MLISVLVRSCNDETQIAGSLAAIFSQRTEDPVEVGGDRLRRRLDGRHARRPHGPRRADPPAAPAGRAARAGGGEGPLPRLHLALRQKFGAGEIAGLKAMRESLDCAEDAGCGIIHAVFVGREVSRPMRGAKLRGLFDSG